MRAALAGKSFSPKILVPTEKLLAAIIFTSGRYGIRYFHHPPVNIGRMKRIRNGERRTVLFSLAKFPQAMKTEATAPRTK
jgi:hypothetical protein